MKVILFGATGMLGQGALTMCLEDPAVTAVLSIGRRPTGRAHAKLVELEHRDFLDFSAIEDRLAGYDACLFCLGISAAGMDETAYRRITVDMAVAASEAMLKASPEMRMCFISGAGTNIHSTAMWARVKGEAEAALLAMPWRSAHMFRPAGILPVNGEVSGVASYRFIYKWFAWPLRALHAIAPGQVTTTTILGRALLHVAAHGWDGDILEGRDIHTAGTR